MLSRLLRSSAVMALGGPVPGVVVLDAETLEPVADLECGGRGGALAPAADGVWITDPRRRTLTLAGPDGEELREADLPGEPVAVALDGAHPVVLLDEGEAVRVDPLTAAVVDRAPVPAGTREIATDAGRIWALHSTDATPEGMDLTLLELDPSTLAVHARHALGRSRYAGGLHAARGRVAVVVEDPAQPGAMTEAVLDAATGERLGVADRPPRVRGLAEREGIRWTKSGLKVRRLDAASGRVLGEAEVRAPRAGTAVVAHDRVYVVTFGRQGTAENEDTD